MGINFKTSLCASTLLLLIASATARPLYLQTQKDLYAASVKRCGSGCSSTRMKALFQKTLTECQFGVCKKWNLYKTTPLGSQSNIQQHYTLQSDSVDASWGVRFQTDLTPSGARLVMVAVNKATPFEDENFSRPFIIGPLIPKNKYAELSYFLANYGYSCKQGKPRCPT